jgi:hypothetical protein
MHDRYMICNEQVVFSGSYEDCVRFLRERDIVVLKDLIEPLDSRVVENEFLLRFGRNFVPQTMFSFRADASKS